METEPVNPPIRLKPPLVAALFAFAGWALNRVVAIAEQPSIPFESAVVGGVIIAISLAVAFLALREMGRAQTPVLPGEPANALVTSGVFNRSRNPIYLAFVLMLIGIGVATANAWMIVMAAGLALYLTALVIRKEEGYLQTRFGPAYADYRKRVRRWF